MMKSVRTFASIALAFSACLAQAATTPPEQADCVAMSDARVFCVPDQGMPEGARLSDFQVVSDLGVASPAVRGQGMRPEGRCQGSRVGGAIRDMALNGALSLISSRLPWSVTDGLRRMSQGC